MKALLVLDVQNKQWVSEHILSNINSLLPKFNFIIFTQNIDYQETKYNLHNNLDMKSIKDRFYIFKNLRAGKTNPTSAFFSENANSTKLKDFLEEQNVHDVYICGINEKWSVNNTAVDAKYFGFDTILIKDAIMDINPTDSGYAWNDDTLFNFWELGIDIIKMWELPIYNTTKNLNI